MNICLRMQIHCSQSWIKHSLVRKINLIISSKHPRAQFYSAEEAAVLVNEGLKIIDWASTAKEEEPELVIAAAGTESNLEALAAVTLLLEEFPKLKFGSSMSWIY